MTGSSSAMRESPKSSGRVAEEPKGTSSKTASSVPKKEPQPSTASMAKVSVSKPGELSEQGKSQKIGPLIGR